MLLPEIDQRKGHDQFLAMLPAIEHAARVAFRKFDPAERDELTQEVVANAYCTFVSLVRRGKQHLAFPSALADYAIKHVHAGRRVGARFSTRDVMSRAAQRRWSIRVESLSQFDGSAGGRKLVLLEDRTAGPAETAAARIDVGAWLRSLPGRNRRIAKLLATGETTNAAARRFRLSAARISQLRWELEQSWVQFQGEPTVAAA